MAEETWTPPADAVEEKSTTWTPPSDSEEVAPVKKKEQPLTPTPLKSEDGTSESTASPSGYAPRSIGEIKQSNAKKLDFNAATILKGQMAKDLSENKSQAYKQKYVETLAKKGYDKGELQKVADVLSPEAQMTPEQIDEIIYQANPYKTGIRAYDNIVNRLSSNVVEGTKHGAEKLWEGAKMMEESKRNASEKGFVETAKEQMKATAKEASGLASGGFAVAGAVVPQLMAFNAAMETARELPKDAKGRFMDLVGPGQVVPKEQKAELFDKAMEVPFTLVSSSAKALGYEAKPDTWQADVMELADLAAVMVLGKAGEAYKGKGIKDINDITQKVADGTATAEEAKILKHVMDEAPKLTLNELKVAAKEKMDAEPVRNDDLHTELADMQSAHDAMPEGEAKQVLAQKIDFKEQEIADLEKQKLAESLGEAKKSAEVAMTIDDLNSRIAQASNEKKNIPAANKVAHDVVDNHIKSLIEQRDSLQGMEKKAEMSPEEIDEMEILSQSKDSGTITNEENLRLTELKAKENALQEQSASGVLQHPQEGVGETGSERGGVEQVEQGVETPKKGKGAEKIGKAKPFSAEKQKFIDEKIDELRNNPDAEFDEGAVPFYTQYFASKYVEPGKAPKVKKATISERQSKINSLHSKVEDFNNLKNGRLGKDKSEGLKMRNEIELEAKDLGLNVQIRRGYVHLTNAKGKKVRAVNTDVNNRGKAENHIPLEKRDNQVKEVFDAINEHGEHAFPVIVGMDGKRMSRAQREAAIQDVIDGVDSNGANELLNQMEGMVKSGNIEVMDPNSKEHVAIPLSDYLDLLRPETEEFAEMQPEQKESLNKEYDEWFSSLSEEAKNEELKQFINEEITDQGTESPQDVVAKESIEVDKGEGETGGEKGVDINSELTKAEIKDAMSPITDKMAEVERTFENEGYEIDWDYDNEISIRDKKSGELVDAEELPEHLLKSAGEYEKATQKLGDFDERTFKETLNESRDKIKGEEVEFEDVTPKLEARNIDKEIADAKSDYTTKQNKYEKAKAKLDEAGMQDQMDIFGKKPADDLLFKNDIKEQEGIVADLKKDAQEAKSKVESLENEKKNIAPENQLDVEKEATKAEEDFDWMSVYDEVINTKDEESPKWSREGELQRRFEDSKFSEKWAKTFKEARDKTVAEYKKAKETFDDWASRDYKKNKGSVWVGEELGGTSKNIGAINEARRQRVLRGQKMIMEESIETLKELGLTKDEVADLIKDADKNVEATKAEEVKGADYKGYELKTPNATIETAEGGGKNSYIIRTGPNTFITGWINNVDFPGSKKSTTRGEVFNMNVSSKRKGEGTSLMLDALRIMKLNGTETVKFTMPSKEGAPFNAFLESKGYIEKIRTAESSPTSEYKITDNVLTKAEKAKALADKIRKGKIDGTMSAPPLLKQAWNGAIEVVAKIIEADGKLEDAIDAGIKFIKESEYYKSKTAKGKELLEKKFRESVEVNPPKKLPKENKSNSLEEAPSKQLKLGERILASDEVSKEIKAGLEKKGIDYVPINLELTQANAKDYVKAFVDAGEIDKAISNVTDTTNGMSGLNRAAIGKELFETLADKAREAETIDEAKRWQDKAVAIAKFTADNFRAAGQEINAAKAWKRMLERTPDGAVASIKQTIAERNEKSLEKHKEDIRSAKEIIDEFVKSDDFTKLVGEKVQSELEKLGKKSPRKENIFNSKKVRDARLEELREKAKKAKGSASASIVGLNSEQIEIYSEMGVIYLIEGAYRFKQWANKMKKENPDFTEEQLDGLWRKAKISKEYDAHQRTLSEFSKKGVFDAMPPEVKKEFLDKLEKKLSKLSPESRKKLLGNALDEIMNLGGLSNERFKEMYAKELGLPGVDALAETKIRALIETINRSDKSGRELQELFDNNASKQEINAKQKEWINDVFEGKKANAELSDYFKDEKKIGNTLSTILQGNLLGTLSLVKNVYSNSLIQPLRFASRGIASGVDYIMAKAQNLPIMDKLIKEGRTIDALAYWKGETKGVMPGLKTSYKELIRGLNPEDMIERDLSQQLQPLKSMVNIYEGLKGEKKQSAYQHINNFAEATFGVPAEVMFRLLNLGDKPFRSAAEFGAAYEIGTLKGLKGKELDKFALFPDAKSAEEIKLRAEKSVYQQSEGIAKVAQQGVKGLETYLSNIPYIGDIAKVVFKSQIPYIKTPLNILGETLTYTFPEYSAAKAIFHATKGERRQSLEHFGKAVTGFGIRYAVNQLVQNNLVTPSADRKDIEGTAIQYQNVPPNSLNITGLQRMMSGGNPQPKDNDTWINYSNMGVLGMLVGVHANREDLKDSEKSYLQDVFSMASYSGQAAIEQSFLQGANTFLEALTGDDKSKRKWAINTLGALGAIVYPNTLANISKAQDNTSRVTRAESFSDELVNTFKTKMFMGGDLPTKVNLWGESVKGAPVSNNKYLWYLLDVTKGKDVDTDSFNYKIYDLWKNAEDAKMKRDVLPDIPRNYLNINEEKVKLSPYMYELYQKYTGKNRASLVEKYVSSPNWKKDSIDDKIEKLKKLYASGANNAKKQLLFEHPEIKLNSLQIDKK